MPEGRCWHDTCSKIPEGGQGDAFLGLRGDAKDDTQWVQDLTAPRPNQRPQTFPVEREGGTFRDMGTMPWIRYCTHCKLLMPSLDVSNLDIIPLIIMRFARSDQLETIMDDWFWWQFQGMCYVPSCLSSVSIAGFHSSYISSTLPRPVQAADLRLRLGSKSDLHRMT